MKFYEEGQLLDHSFFQRKTKGNCLFDFIARDDIYLENEKVSICFDSSFRPLNYFFGEEKEVSLYIIPFDGLKFSEKNEVVEITDSPADDVIVIEDSPIKTQQPGHSTASTKNKRQISDSFSSDEELPDIMFPKTYRKQPGHSTASTPVAKNKRQISYSFSSDEELPDIMFPKTYRKQPGHSTASTPVAKNKRQISDSFSSDEELPDIMFPKTYRKQPGHSTASTPVAKNKRQISYSFSSDEELPDIMFPKTYRKEGSSSALAAVTLPAFSKKRRRISSSSSSDDDLPTASFLNVELVQNVDNLPWDINGDCSFKLPYDKSVGQRMKSSKDGRDWQRYNKSYTKDFPKQKGLRLKASCKGSHQCTNKLCPFWLYYERPNTSHILRTGDDNVCEECHTKMTFISCNAMKIWEFAKDSNFVVIHHKGNHTCFPLKKPKLPAKEIKEVIDINQNLKPCEVVNRILMRTVEKSTSREEVETVAFKLSDNRQMRNLKQKITSSQSLSTKLSELQDKCINNYNDPYLLFEYQIKEQKEGTWTVINSSIKDGSVVRTVTNTNDPDKYCTYIIKSSKEKLKTMCDMMNKDHFLGEEWAFIDFKVNRVNIKGRNLKTFGISTYHTLLKKVSWLVRMDCEKEDSKTVSLGLDTVDRMLKSSSNGLFKTFVPSSGWMLDEGGGLHAALLSKFGEQYCHGNVVTCRLHLNQCTSRHAESAFAGVEGKKRKVEEFKSQVQELVHAPSINKYNEAYEKLDKFITAVQKPQLRNWLNWWDSRRNHVMEAYRPLVGPNTNLAEASHASMELSGGTNLNIVQSAIFDISEAFKYKQMLEGYCLGYIKSGVGPSKATKEKKKDKIIETNIDCLLSELDGQFGGGVAPGLPSTSSFEASEQATHRADRGMTKDKRPEGRQRTNQSSDFRLSLQKAKSLEGYKIIDIEQHSPSQCTVTLKKKSGTFYSIKFDKTTTCTCQFAMSQTVCKHKKVPCKHRIFVLLSVGFSETEEILLQYSYTMQEVRKIVMTLRVYNQKNKSINDLKNLSSIHTDEDDYEITFLQGLISKCYGCGNKFSNHNRQTPYDVVIRHLEVRPVYDRQTNGWYLPPGNKKSNAYYHIDSKCVQRVHKLFDKTSVKIPVEVQAVLSEGHKEVLRVAGFYNLDLGRSSSDVL